MKKPRMFSAFKICRTIDKWTFFLTKKQKRKLNTIKANNIEDYKTWSVYTILLPLAAYLFAFVVNMLFLFNKVYVFTPSKFFSVVIVTLNNGSLPIIAFGIVSSSITYLMEVIDEGDASHKTNLAFLRRKIMSISVLTLFLTSSLYILQSINRDFMTISGGQEAIIFTLTLAILVLAISTGRKMFLLQKNTIHTDLIGSMQKDKKSIAAGFDSQFGSNEA